MITGLRVNPCTNFRFSVEVHGLIVGGFNEVSGLQAETETEEYREGGVNYHFHRFPKVTKYPNLTLKHGITDSDELYKWYRNVISGLFERRNISIILSNYAGIEQRRWNVSQAYPVKWIGPDLKAESNAVAVEVLEIAHHGYIELL